MSIAEIPARFNVAHYLVDARVAEGNGARVPVIAGERRFSYADVQDQANRVANLLRALGGSAAVCYAGDPERTRQTMITDQGKPWIVTSDLLRRVAGYFFYEGRSDDMLKVGGVYVSPLKVENVLLQHHDRGKVLRGLLR